MACTNGKLVPNHADSIAEYTKLSYGRWKWVIWYGPPEKKPKLIRSLQPEEPRLVDQRVVYKDRDFLLRYGEYMIIWDDITKAVEVFGSKVPEQMWRRTGVRYFRELDFSLLTGTTVYQDRFIPCTVPFWFCTYFPASSPCAATAATCGYVTTLSASAVLDPDGGLAATETQATSTASTAPYAVTVLDSSATNASLEVNASCQIATLDFTGTPGTLQLV